MPKYFYGAFRAALGSLLTVSLLLLLSVTFANADVAPVDTSNKAAVTEAYTNYFCPADGIDPEWSGDLSSGEQEGVSAEFLQATLDRLNFYRVMAGLPGNVKLSESLNVTAQDAALFLSSNPNLSSFEDMPNVCYRFGLDCSNPEGKFRHYSPDSRSAVEDGISILQGDAADALHIAMLGDWEDGYVMNVNANNYPYMRREILEPNLSEVGVGSVELSHLHYFVRTSTYGMKERASGIIIPGDTFEALETPLKPIAWPPAGYVPYHFLGPVWSIRIPGANFSTAYISVSTDSDQLNSNQEITLLPRNDSAPFDTLAWNMNAGFRRVGNSPGIGERKYKVSISGIYYQGAFIDYEYEVIEYDPYWGLEGSYVVTDIYQPTLPMDESNLHSDFPGYTDQQYYFRTRVFDRGGCLHRRLKNETQVQIYEYPGRTKIVRTETPTVPVETNQDLQAFTVTGGSQGQYDFEWTLDDRDEQGIYRFVLHFATTRIGEPGEEFPFENADVVKLVSEPYHFSPEYGLRRLNEPFQSKVPLQGVRSWLDEYAENPTAPTKPNNSGGKGDSTSADKGSSSAKPNGGNSTNDSINAPVTHADDVNPFDGLSSKLKKKKRLQLVKKKKKFKDKLRKLKSMKRQKLCNSVCSRKLLAIQEKLLEMKQELKLLKASS